MYPHFSRYIPSPRACSENVRLLSRLDNSIGADALRAKGTKRRVILALFDLLCLFVPASVEMSPSPKLATGTSAGTERQEIKIDSNLA